MTTIRKTADELDVVGDIFGLYFEDGMVYLYSLHGTESWAYMCHFHSCNLREIEKLIKTARKKMEG